MQVIYLQLLRSKTLMLSDTPFLRNGMFFAAYLFELS